MMSHASDQPADDAPLFGSDESAPVSPAQLKVLIVDDDELMRRLVRRALAGFGFTQIFTAEDGAAGLIAAEREAPDVIVADYHMPGMHGLELVEAVRRNEALDQTVIIMLSAADEPAVIERARDLGADTFMVKPFERADLMHLIDMLYRRFSGTRIAWPER